MKMLLIVLAVLAGVVAGGLAWLGAFAPVQIDERDMGPYLFVYVQDPTTDFGRIGELTEALGARLQGAGVTNRKPAQVFYPAGRGIPNQIGFMVDRPVADEVLGADTFFRPIAVERYAVARFPYRNPASFIVGYFRVDPALRRYREKKKYAETAVTVILEGDTIVYLQRVAA